MNKKSVWSGFVTLLFATILTACGGGSGGPSDDAGDGLSGDGVTFTGQAILGPLSGSTILISALDGTVIATSVSEETADLSTAGSFSFTLEENQIPEVVIVSAVGGMDLDADDNGVYGPEIPNKGEVHAYLLKDQLTGGKVTINPLTEVIYQHTSLQYPDGVNSLSTKDLAAHLNEAAKKYIDVGASYDDVLQFIPYRDKATSKIAWNVVLDKLVKGVHEGDSAVNLQNRVKSLDSYLASTGTITNAAGTIMEKVEELEGDRIKTVISKSQDGFIGVLEQQHVDDSGAVISVRAERMSDTLSYIHATIAKSGHTLEFEGVTTLLNGLVFSESGIASVVSNLVTIESSDDNGLTISIDKSLSERISDNEITFSINGREPSSEELSVVLDDPVINWKWAEANAIETRVVAQGYTLQGYRNSNLVALDDGTVVIEVELSDYDIISGLQGTRKEVLRDGMHNMLIDAFGIFTAFSKKVSFLEALVDSLLSTPSDFYFVMSSGAPTASESFFTSTRIGLIGRFDDQKIIPGEKYRPILFIRNKHDDGTIHDLDVSMRYYTQGECNPSCGPLYTHAKSYDIGTLGGGGFTLKKNKGYIVVPARKISFFVSQNGNSHFASGIPKVQLGTQTDKWEVTRRENIEISTNLQNVFTDFTYSVNDGEAQLDASPSATADGEIISYTWNHKGVEVASGKSATIPISDIDSGNGFADVTLIAETSTGLTGRSEKMFALNAQSWRPQPGDIVPLIDFQGQPSTQWAGYSKNTECALRLDSNLISCLDSRGDSIWTIDESPNDIEFAPSFDDAKGLAFYTYSNSEDGESYLRIVSMADGSHVAGPLRVSDYGSGQRRLPRSAPILSESSNYFAIPVGDTVAVYNYTSSGGLSLIRKGGNNAASNSSGYIFSTNHVFQPTYGWDEYLYGAGISTIRLPMGTEFSTGGWENRNPPVALRQFGNSFSEESIPNHGNIIAVQSDSTLMAFSLGLSEKVFTVPAGEVLGSIGNRFVKYSQGILTYLDSTDGSTVDQLDLDLGTDPIFHMYSDRILAVANLNNERVELVEITNSGASPLGQIPSANVLEIHFSADQDNYYLTYVDTQNTLKHSRISANQ